MVGIRSVQRRRRRTLRMVVPVGRVMGRRMPVGRAAMRRHTVMRRRRRWRIRGSLPIATVVMRRRRRVRRKTVPSKVGWMGMQQGTVRNGLGLSGGGRRLQFADGRFFPHGSRSWTLGRSKAFLIVIHIDRPPQGVAFQRAVLHRAIVGRNRRGNLLALQRRCFR